MNAQLATNSHSNAPPRTKKGVKFADEEVVHDVLRRRSQISRQSMAGIWFDGEDFESFIEDVEKSVDKLERGKRLKDKKYSSLGLESLTEEGAALRQAHKEYAWDTVLWEQNQQQEEGNRSSEQLAEAYREASRDAEVRAVRLARQVSDEVLEDYSKSGLEDLLEDSNSTWSLTSLSDDEAELPTDLPRTKPVLVRFADEEEVHKVLRRRSQISGPSKTRIWFQREDFEAFMDEVEDKVEKIDKGEQLDDKEDTTLGLESQTEEGSSERYANQDNAWATVLSEQEDQRKEGITSPFQIARAYKKVSREAVLNAALNAMSLARSVSDDELDLLE
mmetsp:Transcript_2092/g.4719  ORF Transcript_2092/g.4719 Transcript_2092/m.4719 type:complete len:333 (+) Transcript_2092:50-1048(+)